MPGVVIDAESGPVWIDDHAQIMPQAVLEGPLAVGANSIIKVGAKIYENTTIGPVCKVGGEVEESIFQSYSNKQHDGFLGHSYLGSWINLGADTNNSNLKNNYAEVQIWNYPQERLISTGRQFCGLIMGDHSKCGINTMFNTGTVIGVSANIFGSNFPRNFIPSFSWGGASGFITYALDKASETADLVMNRKNEDYTDEDRKIMKHIFEITSKYRTK